jgi:hypothetical protein
MHDYAIDRYARRLGGGPFVGEFFCVAIQIGELFLEGAGISLGFQLAGMRPRLYPTDDFDPRRVHSTRFVVSARCQARKIFAATSHNSESSPAGVLVDLIPSAQPSV